jgi:hypothetical protein
LLSGALVALLFSLPTRADPLPADADPLATEPSACAKPFANEAAMAEPPVLLELAARCREPGVAALFRNRAEHAERLRQLKVMSGLLRPGSGNTDQTRLSQCRLFTALAEAFAERLQREQPAALPQALAQLNLAYAQAIHIAERTIAGHERIVGLPTAPR